MAKSILRGHQVVCSAFIQKNGKFLVVMCPRFKVWRVPGGRAERGEKIEDTLIREMEEETGVIFDNPTFIGFGQDQQYHIKGQRETSRLIMYFHVHTDQDLILDPDEAEDFQRVTFDELKKLKDKEGALEDLFTRNPELSL